MPRYLSLASLVVTATLGCGPAALVSADDALASSRQRIAQFFASPGKRNKVNPPSKPISQKALLAAVKVAANSSTAKLRAELMQLIREQINQKGLSYVPTQAEVEALLAAGASPELLELLVQKMREHSLTLERQAWQACQTRTALQDFLRQYPESQYANAARQRLAEMAWAEIQHSERAEDFQHFITENPAHPQLEAARARLALLTWQATQARGQARAFSEFLQTYPDSPYAAAAQQRLMQSLWDDVKASREPAHFKAFLERFPSGPLADAARVRLEQLQWEATLAGGGAAKDYEEYLRQYPDGHFAATARLRLERLAKPDRFTNHATEEFALKLEETELRRYVVNEVPPQANGARKKFVTVLVVLTPLGTIQSVEAVGGSASLAKIAVAAVNQWTFRPVEHQGKPVAAEGVLTIRFGQP
jgi:outer membrane protein assembly factor BamD (BamD/ComL family)